MAIHCPRYNDYYRWHIIIPGPNGTLRVKCIPSPLEYYKEMNVKPPVGASLSEDFYNNVNNFESDEDPTINNSTNVSITQVINSSLLYLLGNSNKFYASNLLSSNSYEEDMYNSLLSPTFASLYSSYCANQSQTLQSVKKKFFDVYPTTDFCNAGISNSNLEPKFTKSSGINYSESNSVDKSENLLDEMSDLDSEFPLLPSSYSRQNLSNSGDSTQTGKNVSSSYVYPPYAVSITNPKSDISESSSSVKYSLHGDLISKKETPKSLAVSGYKYSPTFDLLYSQGFLPKTNISKPKKTESFSQAENDFSFTSNLYSPYTTLSKKKNSGSFKSKVKRTGSFQLKTNDLESNSQVENSFLSTNNPDSEEVTTIDYSKPGSSGLVTQDDGTLPPILSYYDIPYAKSQSTFKKHKD